MMRKIIFILVVCLVALSSCQWDGKSGNTADVDVRVARYDRLLFEYVTMNNLSALQKMNTDFPQATKLLIEDVLAIGEVDDNKINDRLMEYYADTTLLVLIQDAEEKFKDMESYCAADKMDRTGVAAVAKNRGTLHSITLDNLFIHDINGNVYKRVSCLISEIFFDMRIFDTAYYAIKRPIYIERLSKKEVSCMQWDSFAENFENDLQVVSAVGAYNSMFDFKKAIPFTEKYIRALYSGDYNNFINSEKKGR